MEYTLEIATNYAASLLNYQNIPKRLFVASCELKIWLFLLAFWDTEEIQSQYHNDLQKCT